MFLILISFLVLKSFELQILKGEEFLELSRQNYQRINLKRANRGVIYDKDFNQLVFNDLSFDLMCSKAGLPIDAREKENLLTIVAEYLNKDPIVLKQSIEVNDSEQILISENLDHEILILIKAKITQWPGFYLDENIKRSYVDGAMFSHLIGYLGRISKQEAQVNQDYAITDYIGKSGLEKFYEHILKGTKEKILVEKNVNGVKVFEQKISEAKSGKSLVLWLDSDLQKKISQTLERTLKEIGAKAGAVVVLNPKTGGALGLVSLPSFDNNIFFEELSQEEWEEILNHPENPFWNRVVSAAYPVGSTIKPLVAMGALEEKIVSQNKSIFCEGEISVENPWFPDEPWIFHDWTIHGWTDMIKAIAESCNVYFYTIGGGFGDIKGLGVDRIKKYLELFGWGKNTGIDIPEERPGLIPDKEWKKAYFSNDSEKIWLPGDNYNLSIGQGYLSATPIQVANAFSAIANGGKLLKPMLVKDIVDEERNIIERLEPEVLSQDFVDSANMNIIREGMRQAVVYGSSSMLNDLPVKAAAKTGTAQTSQKDYFHNWVTVFAPYDDPEIVLTIIIENVKGVQFAALPVAKEILQWYFTEPAL